MRALEEDEAGDERLLRDSCFQLSVFSSQPSAFCEKSGGLLCHPIRREAARKAGTQLFRA
jgi:hypothetical protein